MSSKEPKPEKPAPVDVKASVPLEVKLSPESVEALSDATTAASTEQVAAPVLPVAPIAAVGTTTTTVTSTVPPPVMVTKEEGLVLAPTTTAADDKVTEGQRKINLIWESSQSIISIAITAAVIYCQINAIQSETLNNAFFFVVATYLQRTNHVRKGGVPSATANGSYQGR